MDNAINLENNPVFTKSVEMLNSMAEDAAVKAADTLDEAYETVGKYMTIAKEDFVNIVEHISPLLQSFDREGDVCQLTDQELDMVVGGWSLWDNVCDFASKVKNVACNAWNATPLWAKGIIVGAAVGALLVGTLGTGMVGGMAVAGCLAGDAADLGITVGAVAASYAGTIGSSALVGAGVFGVLGGAVGATVQISNA